MSSSLTTGAFFITECTNLQKGQKVLPGLEPGLQTLGANQLHYRTHNAKSRVDVLFLNCHSSLGVEHSLSKRKVVGSNPACGLFLEHTQKKIDNGGI